MASLAKNIQLLLEFLKALFLVLPLTENADPDKYFYSGCAIGFGMRRTFLLSGGSEFGKNVIISRISNSSSAYFDNRNKDMLILGNGPTDGLDDTSLTRETEYSVNVTEQQKKFCLRLH